MDNYQERFSGHTLERKKIDKINYKYFIADDKGNYIKDIDSKYFNCREIDRYEILYEEEEEFEGEYFCKNYEIGFRYFEFSYNHTTPKWKQYFQNFQDSYGDGKEEISELEFENSIRSNWPKYYEYKKLLKNEKDKEVRDELEDMIEQLEFEIHELYTVKNQGGKVITLKSIIDDAGNIIVEEILDVVKIIFEANAVIVKLPSYHGSKWEKQYSNSWGHENELWAVYSLKGELLFNPERAQIKFESGTNYRGEELRFFILGDGALVYDVNGKKFNK
jgi:hypothetical protein